MKKHMLKYISLASDLLPWDSLAVAERTLCLVTVRDVTTSGSARSPHPLSGDKQGEGCQRFGRPVARFLPLLRQSNWR